MRERRFHIMFSLRTNYGLSATGGPLRKRDDAEEHQPEDRDLLNASKTTRAKTGPLQPQAEAMVVPRRSQPVRVSVGAESHEFVFQPDDDLTKLVSVTPARDTLGITVRYVTDAIVQQDNYVLAINGDPTATVDGYGLIVTWRAPLVSWLAWPMIQHKRRF